MSEAEFWDEDPDGFQALYRRHLLAQSQLAVLTSFYVNAHLGEDATETTPLDFIPGMQGRAVEETAEVKAIYDQLAMDKMADALLRDTRLSTTPHPNANVDQGL